VTVNGPDAVDENVNVEDPVPPDDRLTLVGLRVTAGPVGEDVAAREMVPVKLLTLVSVTVDVVEEPAVAVTDVGLIVIEKSGEVEPTVIGFEVDPVALFESVTVSVTVYVPCAE
jgi:hypothetical protein